VKSLRPRESAGAAIHDRTIWKGMAKPPFPFSYSGFDDDRRQRNLIQRLVPELYCRISASASRSIATCLGFSARYERPEDRSPISTRSAELMLEE